MNGEQACGYNAVCSRSLFTIHRFSFILFFKIEIKVKIIHKLWSCKFFQFPAIFLGRRPVPRARSTNPLILLISSNSY